MNARNFLVFIFGWLLLALHARPALAGQTANGAANDQWQRGNLNGLPFRILFPKNYDASRSYPLIVFLHGSYESGNDNESHLKNGVELFATRAYRQRYQTIVVAPQCPPDDSWGGLFYGGESETQKKLIALIDRVSRSYAVDSNRRYLTGVSMGAIGGWDLAARYPGLFAAFLPIAGAMELSTGVSLLRLPIWAFHGDADDAVSPYETREMYSFMQKNNGRMNYTEYPGVGHDSWTQTYREPRVIDWLFQQRL